MIQGHLKIGCDKLDIYTINPKTTTNVNETKNYKVNKATKEKMES